MAKESFRCRWTRCGKARCRSCPHGPYWYAYWWEGGRCRTRYCGKEDPRSCGAEPAGSQEPEGHPHDRIFDSRTASRALALEILSMVDPITRDGLKKRLRELTMLHHPDRGGDPRVMSRINSAVEYLRKCM